MVSHVYVGGDEVDLYVPGTNLERFRVRADALTYVERKPPAKTSNPFTTPEPVSMPVKWWKASPPFSGRVLRGSIAT